MSDHATHASPRTPERGLRRKVVIGAALVGVASAAGLAFGEWLASGDGEGYAKSGVAQALSTESVTASESLYPGGTGDLVLRIHNPNPFPVTVTSVTPNGPISSDDPACDAAGHGVTFAGVSGLSLALGAESSDTFTLTGVLAMAVSSANECQGDVFTVPVALNGGSGGQTPTDQDGDGFLSDVDCNDQNPNIPGPEIAGDGIDNDCDGTIDEGSPVDADGDGFLSDVDCNDQNPNIPGPEIAGDGIDNDCDGTIDEGSPVDADGDGYLAGIDCNDQNSTINPGAPEVAGDGIDNDCDGTIDEGSPVDADGDGFLAGIDCDDANATVHPGATEIAGDLIDQDCDGFAP